VYYAESIPNDCPRTRGAWVAFRSSVEVNFVEREGGGDQIEGLITKVEGGEGVGGERVEGSVRPQELRIRSSAESVGLSSLVQGWS
jgi:hypothetical protein